VNSKERVKKCLKFKNPDRPPRDIWPLPYINYFRNDELEYLEKRFTMDIEYATDFQIANYEKVGYYKDEWGSIWYIGEPGVIGEVKEPFLDNWGKLKELKTPYYQIEKRDYSYINSICSKSEKFIISDVAARPFERLQFIRGTEDLYMDIAYKRPEFYELLKIVHNYNIEDIKSWLRTEVDAIFLMDDWGSNDSLLISPVFWKEVFKPLYKEYCDLIHKKNKYAFFHSDGFIEPIYEDLIEVGMDAINSQLFVMNIEKLGEKYKGKITFWGEIDRQSILPFGKKIDVVNAVRRIRESIYDKNGGFIANCSWGSIDPLENIIAYYEAIDIFI
jgi:uroporphyrinogen decarboxylase